jgi:hypothetical protein
MTEEFTEIRTKYRKHFKSSEDPMSVCAMISFDTLLDLMIQALEENVPLTFGYKTEEGHIIPDAIFIKIGDKIVY